MPQTSTIIQVLPQDSLSITKTIISGAFEMGQWVSPLMHLPHDTLATMSSWSRLGP